MNPITFNETLEKLAHDRKMIDAELESILPLFEDAIKAGKEEVKIVPINKEFDKVAAVIRLPQRTEDLENDHKCFAFSLTELYENAGKSKV